MTFDLNNFRCYVKILRTHYYFSTPFDGRPGLPFLRSYLVILSPVANGPSPTQGRPIPVAVRKSFSSYPSCSATLLYPFSLGSCHICHKRNRGQELCAPGVPRFAPSRRNLSIFHLQIICPGIIIHLSQRMLDALRGRRRTRTRPSVTLTMAPFSSAS